MKKEERFYERIVLFLLLLGTGGMYYSASHAKVVATGSDMASMDFPKGILIVLALLCGGKLIGNLMSLRKNKEDSVTNAEVLSMDSRTWMTVISIIMYALLWNMIGFCISSCFFFYAEALILKRNVDKRHAAIIAVGITLFIFVIFGMAFGVDFQEPLLDLIIG